MTALRRPQRHRLNQGGNHQLNSVIHVAAVTQVRHHGPGKACQGLPGTQAR